MIQACRTQPCDGLSGSGGSGHAEAAFDAGELQFFTDLVGLNEPKAFAAALAPLCRTEWLVYAKKPFAGPKQVLAYLARYTHRVAIANNRLLDVDETHVSFHWKDYREGGDHQSKVMRITIAEFIRSTPNLHSAKWWPRAEDVFHELDP